MKMHELIDREDPKCLYCQSDFDIKLESDSSVSLNPVYNIEILTCQKCKEVFQIYWWDDNDVDSFQFSCKEIVVLHTYDGLYKGFHIGDKRALRPSHMQRNESVSVPEFFVDFSDKKKLHKKLKTYLIFS